MAKRDLHKVFSGDPGVAISSYLKIMAVLGMEDNDAVKWYSSCIRTHNDLSKC